MTNTANLKPASIDHIVKITGRYARTAKLNALMSDVVSDLLDSSTVTHDALLEVQAAARATDLLAHSKLAAARVAFAEALMGAFDAWASDAAVELDFEDKAWMLTSILSDFGFSPDVALTVKR